MTVIAAYLYRNGCRVREVAIDETVHCPSDKSEFVWIGIADPTGEELSVLQERYDLHPLAVEDAMNGDQIPKLDVYDEQLFVAARTAELVDREIVYGSTSVFVGHSHIITVRYGSTRAYKTLRKHLEAAPSQLKLGVDYVLHAILDYIVDGYLPIVDKVEEQVLTMEQETLDAFLSRADITQLFRLRREILRFSRILGPMEEVAARLEHLDVPCIDPEARLYFRDVADHARRVTNRLDGLRDVLSSVFEVANLLEQQRQGVITRKLAAWAALLGVPTAIAGIYGMNFEHMPELKWSFGYYLILGMIAAICVVLYTRFKGSKWL